MGSSAGARRWLVAGQLQVRGRRRAGPCTREDLSIAAASVAVLLLLQLLGWQVECFNLAKPVINIKLLQLVRISPLVILLGECHQLLWWKSVQCLRRMLLITVRYILLLWLSVHTAELPTAAATCRKLVPLLLLT